MLEYDGFDKVIEDFIGQMREFGVTDVVINDSQKETFGTHVEICFKIKTDKGEEETDA